MGALIPARVAAAALLVLVSPSIVRGQTAAAPPFELTALAGAVWIDDDVAIGADAQWSFLTGARAGWRPTPAVTLAGEAWFAPLERAAGPDGPGDATLTGLGGHVTFRPWFGRGFPVDPAFDVGIEFLDADDEEDRGPDFVFGLLAERPVMGRGRIEIGARHHFLTIDEEEVEGVATGRDAQMWEIRAGASLLLGAAR